MVSQNKINLIIYGVGQQKIINSNYLPDSIYLNGNKIIIDNLGYIFIENDKYENQVTMIWNKKLITCEELFYSISNIIEIDLSNFDTSEVISMKEMFYYCQSLEYIKFNNINTSSVTDMSFMFYKCISLETINLTNFNTSNVKAMNSMFRDCNGLISLNISNFDTSKVTDMNAMFYSVYLINEIDVSKMNTSKVRNMDYLFGGCISLISLDISNLNTSQVESMEGLFCFLDSLFSLDLSKLDTSSVTNMNFMFGETSFTSLDLSNFNTSKVQEMEEMFYKCYDLTDLNLSNFDIYNVFIMSSMFNGCTSLISLDLSSFIFYQADVDSLFYQSKSLQSIKFSKEYKLFNYAIYMFYGCSSLKSVDLFNFDFSMIDDMRYMFYECSSLTSLDLINIDTFQVTNMEFLFYGCNSLQTLNFSNWITSSVVTINSMFYDCISLISLDLSNFDTSLINNMKDIFFNCILLTSINLKNFDTSKVTDMQSMFYGCSSLLSLDLGSFNTSLVNNMNSMFYNCKALTLLNLSHFNTKNVVNMASMFAGCKNLEYINFYNYKNNSINNIKDIFFGIQNNLIICLNNLNNESNIQILSELNKLICPINDCSNNWEKVKKRIIYDNYKYSCINECFNDENYKYEYRYFCYNECPSGTHSLINNKYKCEKNSVECTKKYYFIKVEDNSCLDNCDSIDFFNNICKLNNYNYDNYIENKGFLISNIIKGIEEGEMDKIIKDVINSKNDIIKKENDTYYQITSSYNQNNKNYKNISSIKLGECELILKEKYGISKNESLIIFKTDQYIEGFLIPLIEYEIFSPKTKEKLDLKYCINNNINIDIYIPISINETNLFKYEPNSNYFTDICYTYTDENGKDVTLYDRKNNYNINNMSLCPINCSYYQYNSDNKMVICQCQVKKRISLFLDIKKEKIINYFNNKMNIINLNVMKCFKILFSKIGLIKNVGSYIIIFIIIFNIISAIYFYLKGYVLLLEQINVVLNSKILENESDINSRKNIKDIDQFKENSSSIISSSKKSSQNNSNHKINSEIKISLDFNLSKDSLEIRDKKQNDIFEREKSIIYRDYEMNIIPYKEAVKNDKRTYFQLYLSLLKTKHILIFTFKINNDYNPYIMKVCLFFFIFTLNMIINTLFFNDSIMHRIYEDIGIFNFTYFIPQIIYSIIICSIFFSILKNFSLPQRNILEIKYEKNKDNLKARVINVIKCINIKFICFFSFSLFFLLIFWYYLSCFCAVYNNTQIYLLKIVFISFSLSLIYPFIICLLPCIFRIPSLKGPDKCLYIISRIIQLF